MFASLRQLRSLLDYRRSGSLRPRPFIARRQSRYEVWIIWGIGLAITAGIILIDTVPNHRDIAATGIYLSVLLLAANILTIRMVGGVSLVCMVTIILKFFIDAGYEDWNSITAFVRCLTALSAIGFLATRAKQAADNLHLHQIYLTGAQRLSHTGSVNFSAVTDLMSWSVESARIFEYPPEMPVSKSMVLARIPQEDHPQVHDAFERASRKEAQIEVRHKLLMSDGRIKHVHMIATPLFPLDDRCEYLGAVMDITERVQAEEKLYRTQAQLTHICRVTTLGELTASIAHEVKQPLTSIASSAHACRRWLDLPHPNLFEIRAGLDNITGNALRADEVIKRIRALARKNNPDHRPERMNELIRETLTVMQYELNHHNISLSLALDAGNPQVRVDRVQMQQVLINLIMNACQAMSSVDHHRRLLQMRTSCDHEKVIVEIADAGPGIDAMTFPSLFTPFVTTRETGMGMGLAICRSIVEFHLGAIWARNLINGSAFYFSLPKFEP
ncbi:sensor histidine kinase [Pseudomonas sp. NPDC090202]|uniref:sensor histidine kinase n=1 Tax=unclassified Pseudomonas TaxID=196821 RepID=UPI0038007512